MLKLTPAEQAWLDEYRQTLANDYPGLVDDIIIYGPHTRGVTDPDIELRDTLVLIKRRQPPKPRMPSATWDTSRR